MRNWRSRSISNNDTSDQQLEAGLAQQNRTASRIPEEFEDVGDATLTNLAHEPKTDASEPAARSTLDRRATFADDYHVEDLHAATEKQEDPSALTRTRTAASKFFKWPRTGKHEDQSAQDETTHTGEKPDNNLSTLR